MIGRLRPGATRGSVRRRSSGQTLSEFALMLPVMLALVFGLIDVGRAVFINNTLANAAREGARVGAVQAPWRGLSGTNCGAPVCPPTAAALKRNVVTAVNAMAVSLSSLASSQIALVCETPDRSSVSTNCSSNNTTAGNRVRVTVTHTYLLMTPIVSQIVGPIRISNVATSTIIH